MQLFHSVYFTMQKNKVTLNQTNRELQGQLEAKNKDIENKNKELHTANRKLEELQVKNSKLCHFYDISET